MAETADSGRGVERPSSLCEPWASFHAAGLAPAFDDLRLIARAITPRGSPIRFHTRFFLSIDATLAGKALGDGELEEIDWIPLAEAPTLAMSPVTAAVLREAGRQAQALARGEDRPPARFFYRRMPGGEAIRLRIQPAPRLRA